MAFSFQQRVALLLVPFALWAQSPRVVGSVKSNQRAIPGAVIELRLATGETVSTVTAEDGSFTLDAPAGAFALSVEMFGFEPFTQQVSPEQRGRPLELALTLGRTAPVAPVKPVVEEAPPPVAAAPSPELDSSESLLVQGSLSRGLEGTDVMAVEEPAGEDPKSLRRSAREGAGGGGGLMTGGAGARAKLGKRGNTKASKKGRQRGAAGAAFGNRTKSGFPLRGTLALQARHSLFDAAPYAVNGQNLAKPDYRQARFSATVGGALMIPKLLDDGRTQFTFNYENFRRTNPYTSFSTLPGAAERAGDFANTRTGAVIFDPVTQAPFPANRIPATRISPIATGLLDLIPLANQTGAIQNFRVVTTVPQNTQQISLSLARPVTVRDRVTFQMSLQGRNGVNVQPYGFRDPTEMDGRNFDLRWNHTFSPRLILNAHGRYNVNQNVQRPFFAFTRDVSGELGIQGNSRAPINWGPPNLNFTNYGDLQDGAHSDRRIHTFTYGSGVTHVRGRVTTTAGAEFARSQWNTNAEANARGTLFFGGLLTSGRFNGFPQPNTGSDFADFLLGLPQQASLRAGAADTYLRSSHFSAYGQQAIRVSRKLSVNLGGRYEVWRPFTERYGRMVNLDLNSELTRVEPVLPGATGPFTGEFPRGLIDTDWNNFTPRVGLAWKPHKRLAVRAGYGIYMDGTAMSRLPTRLAAQPPFAATSSFNTSATNLITLAQPFTGSSDVRVRNTYAVDRHYLIPYAQSWNYVLDFDLPNHLGLELTYLGTKGTRLVMQRQPNRAAPGSPANSEDRRRIENAIGFTYDSTEGNSIFHAGQVKFQRKYSKGLAWNALYTFAKTIDNATTVGGAGNTVVQDDRNYAAERGLSAFDRRHTLAVNTTVMSPFGRNGHWLRDRENKFARLLEGWLTAFTLSARTGTPLTARVLGSVADAAGTGATGSGRASATGLAIDGGRFFNPAAFTLPTAGTFGTAGRNTIPGPSFVAANFSVGRSFRLGDAPRRRIEVRAESENVLNQVNFTGLGVVVNALEYGLPTRAGDMRHLNFTVRFRF